MDLSLIIFRNYLSLFKENFKAVKTLKKEVIKFIEIDFCFKNSFDVWMTDSKLLLHFLSEKYTFQLDTDQVYLCPG